MNDTASNETWIILGASSTIAKAFARSVSETGAHVILAGRRMDDLDTNAADATARGAASATPVMFDAREPATFQQSVDAAVATGGVLNCAVFVGSMPAQDAIDADPSLVDGTITDSFTGPARFLQMLAPYSRPKARARLSASGPWRVIAVAWVTMSTAQRRPDLRPICPVCATRLDVTVFTF